MFTRREYLSIEALSPSYLAPPPLSPIPMGGAMDNVHSYTSVIISSYCPGLHGGEISVTPEDDEDSPVRADNASVFMILSGSS